MIDRRTEVTVAESFLVHEVTERLGVEQGIGGSIDIRQEIVVARYGVAALSPETGAVEVGTDGQYHGRLFYHRLVEMGGCQFLFHLLTAGDDDTVELQVAHGVAHGLGTGCLCHQTVEQFLTHILIGVLADGSSCQ